MSGAILNLLVFNFQNFGEGLASILSLIVGISLFIYFCFTIFFLLRNQKLLGNTEFAEKCDEFYDGLKIDG